ncbi:MAG: hypothetical protein WEB78_06115 [Ilumatobacteraceae bacterium]
MDVSKFKTTDWLKVGGGAVFFIAGFLTWWKAELAGFTSNRLTGVGDYFGTVGLAWLIFTAIAVLTVLSVLDRFKLPGTLPVPLVFLVASAVGLLLVLTRFLFDGVDTGGVDVGDFGIDISRGIGNWLGTAAAIVVVVGCVLSFTESGGDLNDLKDIDKIKSQFGGSGGETSPRPPAGGMPPPPPPPPV